ncbi:MAG: class I poly(R)-hydroxyalkanoic acid synthase [Pseudomonadota bacterium]
MNDTKEADKLISNITKIGEKYQEVLMQMLQHKASNPFQMLSSEKVQEIATQAMDRMMSDPTKFMNVNLEYATKFTALVTNTVTRFAGEETVALYNPDKRDRRFKDPAWQENAYFDFIKQFYLMSSEWMQKQAKELALEPRSQQYLEFYTKQFIDAFCPSNFPLCNPEVVKESLSTKWENIVQGLDNLLQDLSSSEGLLSINTTDKMAFKLGKNIASTDGKVVMQNDLMQLICYKPKGKVHATPILISPPWVNKYYILDLSPENSFVKYLVEQNFQVFLISWVNPGKSLSHKNFEDYAKEGIVDACSYICEDLKFKNVNAIGYCIGGTLLATALAYMKAKNIKHITSATYFTTLLDFSDPGEVGMFINEDTVPVIEAEMERVGYFDGRYLANSFSILRANDLIWSFFVNNYLLGRRPLPFDLLYWNSDPANLPAAMHSFYLRNMYLQNGLTKAGRVEILGVKIDLSNVDIPSFFMGAKDDHIAPWRSVYSSIHLLGGEKKFCLSTSGHVAGVINPPSQTKYSYWTSEREILENPDEWLANSKETMGSWWPCLLEWQKKYSGEMVESDYYQKLRSIEPAPGSYVSGIC